MIESGIQFYYNNYSFPANSLQVFYSFLTGTGSTVPDITPSVAKYSGTLASGSYLTTSGAYFNSSSGSYLQVNNASGLNFPQYTILISETAQLNTQNKVGGILLSSLSTGIVSSGFLVGLNDNNQFFFYAYDSYENPMCYTLENNVGEKNLFGLTIQNNAINLFYYNFNNKSIEQSLYFTNYPIIFNPNWYLGNYPQNDSSLFRPFNGAIDGLLIFSGALNNNQLLTICSGVYSYANVTSQITGFGNSGQITGYSSTYSGVTGITGYQNVFSGYWTGTAYDAVYNLLSGITGIYYTGSGLVTFDNNIFQCKANQYIITGQGVMLTGVTGYITGTNQLFSGSGLEPLYVLSIYTQTGLTGFIYSGINITPLYLTTGTGLYSTTGIYQDLSIINSYGMDTLTYVSNLRDSNAYNSNFLNSFDKWTAIGAGALGIPLVYNTTNPDTPISSGWLLRQVFGNGGSALGIKQQQNVVSGQAYYISFELDTSSTGFSNIGVTDGNTNGNITILSGGYMAVFPLQTGQINYCAGTFICHKNGSNSPRIQACDISGNPYGANIDGDSFYIKNIQFWPIDFIEYDFFQSGSNVTQTNKEAHFDNASYQFILDSQYNATGINAYLNGVDLWGSGAFTQTGIKQIGYILSGEYFITGYDLEMQQGFLSGTDVLLYDIFFSGDKQFIGKPASLHLSGTANQQFILTGNLISSNPIFFLNGVKLYSGRDYIITGTTLGIGGKLVTGLLATTNGIFNYDIDYSQIVPTGFFWQFNQFSGATMYTGLNYDIVKTGKFARGASMCYLNGIRQWPTEYLEHSYLDLISGQQIYTSNLAIINNNQQFFAVNIS